MSAATQRQIPRKRAQPSLRTSKFEQHKISYTRSSPNVVTNGTSIQQPRNNRRDASYRRIMHTNPSIITVEFSTNLLNGTAITSWSLCSTPVCGCRETRGNIVDFHAALVERHTAHYVRWVHITRRFLDCTQTALVVDCEQLPETIRQWGREGEVSVCRTG